MGSQAAEQGLRLAEGTLLALHRRAISAALRAAGRDKAPDFARYHRVLTGRAGRHGPRRSGCWWVPGRHIVAVTDTGYAALDLLGSLRHRLCVVTRLRLDARLFDPMPPRRPGTIGRPRGVGGRQPTLARRLADPATRWESVAVAGWYGGGDRRVEIATGTAVWHHPGLPVVPLR